jgi:CDP-glucose 4,6-dehydratase
VGVKGAFVTGAHGLLGGRLVPALLERGVRVAVLRRDEPALSALALEGTEARVDVVPGDVRDAAVVERALAEYELDTVFHLAAQTLVGTALRSPAPTFDTNVRGTWTVLEAARRVGVARVVVAASDKAYGASDELPYREDTPLRPRYPYDASKAAADLISRSYWHTYELPVAVTRFANLYGAGDLNFSRLVPEAIAAALQGRAPVIRSDGTPERDFLHVDDAVAAYLAIVDLLERDVHAAAGEAFNAGSGRPTPVLEVVRAVCAAAGVESEPDLRGEARAEIDRQFVDATKLRERTGWEPRVSLEAGLARTVEWYRAHPEVLPAAPVGA